MMKKNFILPLLSAAATLTGVAQGAASGLDIEGKDFSSGNWSIVLDLKTDKIQDLIKGPEESGLTANNGFEGVNLVSWSGSADYAYGGSTISSWLNGDGTDNYGKTVVQGVDRTASFWLGWGNDYFGNHLNPGTGMTPGLHMGFAEGGDAVINENPNLNSEYDTLVIVPYYKNAGFYRSHTRYDEDGNFLQTNSTGTDSAQTMDNLRDTLTAEGSTFEVTSATLALVHSNDSSSGTNHYGEHKAYEYVEEDASFWGGADGNNYKTEGVDTIAHSQTMQYLSITFTNEKGESITITYIAEVDDGGSTNPEAPLTGSAYPSSNRYDVDVLENVLINTDYVTQGSVYDYALAPGEVAIAAGIPIPEPTSATLSMMALTALCARRRRRK